MIAGLRRDQLGGARDRLEDIVEIVRDTAGKLAERLLLLALRELGGEISFLRQITALLICSIPPGIGNEVREWLR